VFSPTSLVTSSSFSKSTLKQLVCNFFVPIPTILPGLAAGSYTLVLSDAGYWPLAVNPGPPSNSLLSDGFGSLGAPSFQTCNTTSDGTTCVTRTASFAVDILANGIVPEPGTFALVATGLTIVVAGRRRSTHRSF